MTYENVLPGLIQLLRERKGQSLGTFFINSDRFEKNTNKNTNK